MLHTSLYWKEHFRHNLTKKRIDWSTGPSITQEEKRNILYSLKAWQLGETSEGKHLLAAATRYSKKIDDPEYVEAIRLFIKEEQKHGANLGAYIDMLGEERVKKDWGDSLFRKIRYFNKSMELWTITVIIVESAAQIFYAALRDATRCKLLKSICQDILIDEANHIKFQNERMYNIFQRKSFYNKAVSIGFYAILFFGTMHAIWWGHRKAFLAGGISRTDFFRMMYYKFFKSMQFLHAEPPRETKLVLAYSAGG
jgi:hypothetical protein